MQQDKKGNRIVRSMLSVSGIVLLAKVLGFGKQIITANVFGANIHTDMISLSEGLVSNMDYLLVQALSTAFVPTYIYTKTKKTGECDIFVSNTIKMFLLITLAISGVFFGASPFIARILAPKYTKEQVIILARYIRILAPVIMIIVQMALYNSLLKANERFVPGELTGFNQSVITIVLILIIGSRIGPDTLIIAFYAYAIFNMVYLMVCSRRLWGIHAGNPFADENVKRLVKMMGPLLLGYSMIFVNQQVDKMIVSGLGDGVITAMTYASVLSNFITTFVGSICAVLFTYITQNIAEKKDQEAARLTMESASQMITLLLPISVLTMVNAGDIVSIVFGRGRFDQTAVGNCALALTGYGLMFVPVALRELLTRFQYGYEDSKTPMINSTIAIALNIVLSILLSLRWGVLGVTLATSISVIVCAILNFRSSRKRNTSLDICLLSGNLIPWLGGAALCILISFGGRAVLGNSAPLVRFFLVVIISGLLYGIINFSVIRPMIRKIIRRR